MLREHRAEGNIGMTPAIGILIGRIGFQSVLISPNWGSVVDLDPVLTDTAEYALLTKTSRCPFCSLEIRSKSFFTCSSSA